MNPAENSTGGEELSFVHRRWRNGQASLFSLSLFQLGHHAHAANADAECFDGAQSKQIIERHFIRSRREENAAIFRKILRP